MKGASHDQICKMILGQLKEEGIEIEMAPLKRILCHHAMALCGIVSAGKIAQVDVFGVMVPKGTKEVDSNMKKFADFYAGPILEELLGRIKDGK